MCSSSSVSPLAPSATEPLATTHDDVGDNAHENTVVLSFAAASVLPPEERLRALQCLSTRERLESAEKAFVALERRLSTEIALQSWADESGAWKGPYTEGYEDVPF